MSRFLTLIFLFCFYSSVTNAYTFNNSAGASFDKDEVSIHVASHACNNIGITNSELLSLAGEAAHRFWNDVPTSRLELRAGSIKDVSSNFATGLACQTGTNCVPNDLLKVDNDILIACNTNSSNFGGSVSVLGVSLPNNIVNGKLVGSLILVNDNVGNSFANKSRDEMIAIIAHEIGHAIGLGHSKFDHNLMYYQSIPTRFKLGWDDVQGISHLYPANQPDIGSCGTVSFVNTDNPSSGKLVFSILLGLALSFSIRFRKTKNS